MTFTTMQSTGVYRTVHLIAHRGNARDFPENTLPALESAMDLGLRFVEFDVHLSADQIPVVIHDHLLQRTAGIPGNVLELSAAELGAVEVNERERLGDRFKGVRIPLLADVMKLIEQRRTITAFVEIKRASLRHFGTEVVVARVAQALKPLRSRCVVISFDLPAVHLAHQYGLSVGWVLENYDEHSRLKCEAMRPQFLFCNHEKLPRDDSKLWRGPWRWALYEVETPQLAVALAERGADFIETMAVGPMMETVRAMPSRPVG